MHISRRVLPHDVAALNVILTRLARRFDVCAAERRWGKMCAVMKKIWDSSETTTRKSGIGGDFYFEQQKVGMEKLAVFSCVVWATERARCKKAIVNNLRCQVGSVSVSCSFAWLWFLRESSSSSLNYNSGNSSIWDNYSAIWQRNSQFDLSPVSTVVDRLWREQLRRVLLICYVTKIAHMSFVRAGQTTSSLTCSKVCSQQSSWENLRSRFFPLLHLDKWLKVRFRRDSLSRLVRWMIFGRFVSNF